MSDFIEREDAICAVHFAPVMRDNKNLVDKRDVLENIENIPEVPPKETLVAELRLSEEELERQVKECVDKIVVRCVDCKYQDTCYKSVTVRTRRGAELKACSAGRRKDEGEEG